MKKKLLLLLILVQPLLYCTSSTVRVGLWNAGIRTGNFGFQFCQNTLNGHTDTVSSAVFNTGYRTALFVGASNLYNFANLSNFVLNTNNGVDLPSYLNIDRESKIDTFDSSTGVKTESDVTLSTFITLNTTAPIWKTVQDPVTNLWTTTLVTTTPGTITSEAQTLLSKIGLNAGATAWSFSDSNGNYVSGNSCKDSTSTEALIYGQNMVIPSINTSSTGTSCSASLNVICIAK